jgi:hypothetical protein
MTEKLKRNKNIIWLYFFIIVFLKLEISWRSNFIPFKIKIKEY